MIATRPVRIATPGLTAIPAQTETPVQIAMTAATPAIDRTATLTEMTEIRIIARQDPTETEIRRAIVPRIEATCVARISEFGSAAPRVTGW